MSLRFPLAAALVVVGLGSVPAFAMETIHIPDANTPDNSAPPDGLFDSSIPNSWQKKSDSTDSQFSSSSSNQSAPEGFHFSVSGGSGQMQTPSAYGDARAPGSEFYQAMPGYSPDFGYVPASPH
jgi:hypothetical protein